MQLLSTTFCFKDKTVLLQNEIITVRFFADRLERDANGKIVRVYTVTTSDLDNTLSVMSYFKPTNRNAHKFAAFFKKQFWKTRQRKANA